MMSGIIRSVADRRALVAALLASTALAGAPHQAARAQDATWLAAPGSADMLDAANWSSGTVPTGTATFAPSSTTTLTLDGNRTFGGWTFAANAPAYSITTSSATQVIFTGAGFVVNGAAPAIASNGTMGFQGSSTAGSAAITNSFNAYFMNTSSAGSATITNNFLLRFFDTSSAGSATITNRSLLGFYDVSTAGSAAIITNGNLAFFNTSSAGAANITNLLNANFYDTSSAGSATITNNGTLQFYHSSTAGSATITNNTFKSLAFNGSSSLGSAAVTNALLGFVTFLDTSSAGAGTIANSGSLQFVGSSSAGTATITNSRDLLFRGSSSAGSATITNNSVLSFEDTSGAGSAAIANNLILIFRDGTSGGTATITNNAQALYLAFLGSSSAGSATITNNGPLQFYATSSAGSATITNNGDLTFGGASSTGTATITGAGAINLATTDTAGAATVMLQSGGALSGYGAVGNTTVQSGATFQPSGGTLHVNGTLTLGAGSVYRFTPGGLAAVTGAATLGGAGLQFSPTSFLSQTYTVLTAAGGVGGTFTLDALHAGLGSVLYGTNDVTLTINGYRSGAALGGSGGTNAHSVAAALDRVIDASGGAPPASLNPLLGLYGASLANSLNSLSGEAATGAQSTALTGASTFLGLMLDPMGGSRGAMASAPGSSLIEMADTAAARAPAERVEAAWSIWTKSYGSAGRTASDAATGAAGSASSLYGVAAGADKILSPGTLVGFAIAGGGTSFGLGPRGSGTGDFAQIGLYGSTRLGPGYVSAALAYGWNRFDVSRTVDVLGINEIYRSAPVVHTFGGRIETGRRFAFGAAGLTPYLAGEAIAYATSGYRETFAAPATGAMALAYAGRTVATFRGEAGIRGDAVVAAAASYSLHAFGRLAYAGQTNTRRAADASFQQLANSGFTVFGARASTHTALATVGVETRLRQGARIGASLDGELGNRHRSLRANLSFSQSW